MENDRLFLIAAPGASPAEMLAVRKLVKVRLSVPPFCLSPSAARVASHAPMCLVR